MDPLVSLFGSADDLEEMPESLPPEIEEGNVEYKLKLVNPTGYRFEHLVTQMKWRLQEGQGEAIYEIGVEDSGMLAGLTEEEMSGSLETLNRMAERLGANISILREKQVDGVEDQRDAIKRVAEVLIRRVPDNQQFIDLRLAVLGNVDAGKSTLLGVLTQGELDNGRGRARLNLFRHLHEIQSGRTSSISHEILGFNSKGEVVNYSESRTAEEICENSTKLITLIDLCGHHKYLKTTVFGLTGYSPDFAALVVSANTGIVGTTKEHLGFALALRVPIFVVVTKIDHCRRQQVDRCIRLLEKLLKSPGCKKIPFRVENDDDAVTAASTFHSDSSSCRGSRRRILGLKLSDDSLEVHFNSSHPSLTQLFTSSTRGESSQSSGSAGNGETGSGLEQVAQLHLMADSSDKPQNICPVFTVSSVTGENLELLTKFLNVLPPLQTNKDRERFMQEHTEHQIDVVYSVPDVGTVVGGTLLRGTIKEGETLLVGPTDDGRFCPLNVNSIHRNRLPCRVVMAGQAASLGVAHFDECPIRKGMVLLSPNMDPAPCIEFEAEVYLLFHTSFICKGFQTVVHVGNVCQTAKIIQMNKGYLQTNEKATVVFRFNNRPEYIRPGSRLIFREGRTKGMGEVTKVIPYDSPAR